MFDLFCLFGIRRAKDENALEIDFGVFDAVTRPAISPHPFTNPHPSILRQTFEMACFSVAMIQKFVQPKEVPFEAC